MMRQLIFILLIALLSGAAPNDARKANEAYNNGEYERAVELYKRAISDSPDNARLYFNLGNALARSGQPEEAIRVFEQYKTMTEDPEERAKADYNIGKVYSDTEKWDRALDAYRNALRYRNGDMDAKHNYELARRKKQDQDENQQNRQQQDQQEDQQQQDEQQDQQQQERNQDRQQQDQQDQQQNPQDRQSRQEPVQMTRAEAEKILQALEQKESELLKEFKKQKTESGKNTDGKDW